MSYFKLDTIINTRFKEYKMSRKPQDSNSLTWESMKLPLAAKISHYCTALLQHAFRFYATRNTKVNWMYYHQDRIIIKLIQWVNTARNGPVSHSSAGTPVPVFQASLPCPTNMQSWSLQVLDSPFGSSQIHLFVTSDTDLWLTGQNNPDSHLLFCFFPPLSGYKAI